MNLYKWMDKEQTKVVKHPSTFIVLSGNGWKNFQEYLAGGGQVDPYKTFDEWVQDALSRCFAEHDQIISVNSIGTPTQEKTQKTKMNKAQRAAADGSATPAQEALLDDNDILDTWYDEMETAAESENHGEQWIEDPARTEQELIDYDPVLVPWPEYPL